VLTDEGRTALRIVGETKSSTKARLAALGTLSAIVGTERGAENVRPLTPLDDNTDGTMDFLTDGEKETAQ